MSDDLQQRLEQIGGCSDGNCIVVKPVGMHTNGGCRCWRDGFKMQQVVHAYKQGITTLTAERDEANRLLALAGEGGKGCSSSASAESAAAGGPITTVSAPLEGCVPWLRDMAIAYRGDAEGIIGGMRLRMLEDADDCERWADEIDRLSSAKQVERASSRDEKSIITEVHPGGGGDA